MASDTQFSIDSEPDVYFVSRDEQDESDIFHKAFLVSTYSIYNLSEYQLFMLLLCYTCQLCDQR